jgi:hypothetical protein
VTVDLFGYFADESLTTGGGFVPMSPARLADTRVAGGLLAARTVRTIDVAGMAGVSPDATAVVLSVVAVQPSTRGYLQVYPGNTSRPGVSSINYIPGENTSNSVIAQVGDDGTIDMWASAGSLHVVVDVHGYFDPDSEHGGYIGITPHRLLDTRTDFGALSNETIDLDVVGHASVSAGEAVAVILNVTAAQSTTRGRLTVYPAGAPRPSTSSMNFAAGTNRASQVVVAVGDLGRVSIEAVAGSVHVVVDIVGWFTGVQLAEGGSNPVITGDGTQVAYQSLSARVTDDDDNELLDAFIAEVADLDAERVSVTSNGGSEAVGTRTDPETGLTVDCVNGADPAVGTGGGVVVYVSNGDLADDRPAGEEVSAVYLSTRAT